MTNVLTFTAVGELSSIRTSDAATYRFEKSPDDHPHTLIVISQSNADGTICPIEITTGVTITVSIEYPPELT